MLRSKSCQNIVDCIADIYQIIDDHTHWQSVLQRLSEYVNTGKASITVRNNTLGHIDMLDVLTTKTYGFSKEYVEKVFSGEINEMNHWLLIESKHKVGELCVYNDHLPFNRLVKTDFYKEWLEPQGLTGGVAVQVFKNEYFRVVLTVKYNEPDDSNAVCQLHEDLKILIPHLCQASSLWMKALGMENDFAQKGRTEYLMSRYKLSKRELEVASALVRLSTIHEVAKSLHISENTVKSHIKNVKGKMDIHTSHEMMLRLFSFIDDSALKKPATHHGQLHLQTH